MTTSVLKPKGYLDRRRLNRVMPSAHRCCRKAVRIGCKCHESWRCPEHGEYHSGSKR